MNWADIQINVYPSVLHPNHSDPNGNDFPRNGECSGLTGSEIIELWSSSNRKGVLTSSAKQLPVGMQVGSKNIRPRGSHRINGMPYMSTEWKRERFGLLFLEDTKWGYMYEPFYGTDRTPRNALAHPIKILVFHAYGKDWVIMFEDGYEVHTSKWEIGNLELSWTRESDCNCDQAMTLSLEI